MSQSSSPPQLFRFGVFEIDLAAGELRKNGAKVRLQEQPFQVLALLLERRGEVVPREELRKRLWPADTFVDFDHSLNTAVNKIREALGDSASSPRFVETVARRGYRFLGPVESVVLVGELPTSKSAGTSPLHANLDVPLPDRRVTRGLFLLIQVMYLVFYLEALFHLQAIEPVAGSIVPGWAAFGVAVTALIAAGVGIPLRCYLISAAAFDYRRLGEKFRKMFPAILVLDELWAMAPFLLVEKIGFGAAFAATAALVYSPFAERTLIRLAYPEGSDSNPRN